MRTLCRAPHATPSCVDEYVTSTTPGRTTVVNSDARCHWKGWHIMVRSIGAISWVSCTTMIGMLHPSPVLRMDDSHLAATGRFAASLRSRDEQRECSSPTAL